MSVYRIATPMDHLCAAMALPVSRTRRLFAGVEAVGAPLQAPRETLREIRQACHEILPGATFRRRLFFRYTIRWRKTESIG